MTTTEKAANSSILIVDDQKLHAYFLEKVLKQEGYTNVSCITDPLKVIQAIHDSPPDLLILDLDMPQIDGFQIMEQLHDFRDRHYMPILTITDEKNSDTRLRALQSGATDFIFQPYEVVEILSRIKNMIEMRLLHLQVENQNKILEHKVHERTQELRETQLDIIRRLAQAAEFRDSDTGTHIIRMSHYCELLGKAVGFDDAKAELLLNASPLHDVGKIGIPDSILLKPGKLTGEEFEIMKTHTTIGGKLLAGSESPVMKMACEIALTHHEKWDGTGYPNHLKADQIPLTGQLCSICDVFDALTSARPYKEAWTDGAAYDEILRLKGTQFNPAIVDRFAAIFDDVLTLKKKYS